jgi:hypothetical protein
MGNAQGRDLTSRRTSRFERFTILIGRRGLLAALLTLPGVAIVGEPGSARPPGMFCDERAKGERCRKDGQCCSGRCKKKKHKRNGTCRCSALQARCGANTDCCGHEVGNNSSPLCKVQSQDASARCCLDSIGAPCQEHEDCCGILNCSASKTCDL